ncbi:MAG: aminodeoxychorismate synthase component I [Gemmatimonadota bacterium]|nr:aminodeoxychorismate synthase component I [Gemmatimonadota bacterium]
MPVLHDLPLAGLEGLLQRNSFFVLLDTALPDHDNHLSYLFLDPVRILRTRSYDEVPRVLARAEKELSQGFWIAGALSYEAGYALEDPLAATAPQPPGCLLRLGVFEKPLLFDHRTGKWDSPLPPACPGEKGSWELGQARLETSRQEFLHNVEQARKYIQRGETYQVNYTTRYRFGFQGSPVAYYRALRERQPVPYAGLFRDNSWWALCLSPELFFRLHPDGRILARPMKGTARRGLSSAQDRYLARSLAQDIKNRAENLMIVDLIRNDLGRVCSTGSVHVPSMFEVERYETLLQMTSTVAGRLNTGQVGFETLMRALFPSGSVTGAPKIRTMQIIAGLEPSVRGIYTGTLGFLAPDGPACFNVAIRTVEIESGTGTLGVGGGIVADSEPAGEYEECLLKARFLTGLDKGKPAEEFELIETMLFDGRTFPLVELHLDRMRDSARYFNRPFNRRAARSALECAVECPGPAEAAKPHRVRLLLDRQGKFSARCSLLEPLERKPEVAFYGCTADPEDRFLYHKTTRRTLYSGAFNRASEKGLFDYIFTNRLGQVTEGCISNVYAEFNGVLFTPPLKCGVLPGIYRQWLRRSEAWKVRERILYPEDLRAAERLWVSNAVRGLVEVKLVIE